MSSAGESQFRVLVDQILSDYPEHNRQDEHQAVLEAIVQAFVSVQSC